MCGGLFRQLVRSYPVYSMQRSYPSVDTGNAQSMYVPAGIALEKLYELAGIEILALTGDFDVQLLDEVVSYKADPLAWVTSTSSRHDTHRRKRPEAPLCCLVIQARYSALGIRKRRQGPPPSCNASRAAANRPGVRTRPVKQSGSQWVAEKDPARQPPCRRIRPVCGAACISIRRVVAGSPVERTKRRALRGTEFRQGAPVSHR